MCVRFFFLFLNCLMMPVKMFSATRFFCLIVCCSCFCLYVYHQILWFLLTVNYNGANASCILIIVSIMPSAHCLPSMTNVWNSCVSKSRMCTHCETFLHNFLCLKIVLVFRCTSLPHLCQNLQLYSVYALRNL